MYEQLDNDEERRRNRINMASASQKLKKSHKKQKRKALFKEALKEFIHQIKIIVIAVVIVSIIILILCTSAWYILENEAKNDKKEKIKSIVPLIGIIDHQEMTNKYKTYII